MDKRSKTRKEEQTAEDAEATARRRRIAWIGVAVVFVIAAGILVIPHLSENDNHAEAAVSRLRLEDIPFNGQRAYEYLKQLTAIGPRRSGSEGMTKQQKLIIEHFQKLGATVELQQFTAPDPRDKSRVPMTNIIVHWKPERKERILLCTHYDTLPFPMLDRRNPQGRFVGANDGASGVALLMELGNDMKNVDSPYGVDFVLFDGEEYIFRQYDRFFLGSEFFARQYRDNPPDYKYVYAVLLDMIGDADLQLPQERYSMDWQDSRKLVGQIWATARRLGVKEFIPRKKHYIRDDHLPLHNIAGIPACDIIDFDYPHWHTEGDTEDKCSPLSLAKVGWVIREWLQTAN